MERIRVTRNGGGSGAALVICAVLFPLGVASAGEPKLEGNEFFEKKIRPILVDQCFRCHRGDKVKGNLHLDSRAGLLKGGDSGPAILSGDPKGSLLIKAVGYKDEDLRMPPRSKLADAQIADLTSWVRMGAPWPESDRQQVSKGQVPAGFNFQERRKLWCWQPIQMSVPPRVKHPGWAHTPIDFFILSKLEEAGLEPAPTADRRALLRRLTYDLTGLPPTPAEIRAFLADKSADAYTRVVDRLLASPRYGERWGRHWLDLVRYAETYGHEFDFEVPEAHAYRDYVVRALNADVPYDQFVIEHLAGDLLDHPRQHPREGFNESILGTGYWFLGESVHSPVDVRADEADRIDNQIDVFAKTFLGLTVACARCHDHKFDAITTKDYYSLAGYLESSRLQRAFIDPPETLQAPLRELGRLHDRMQSLLTGDAQPSPTCDNDQAVSSDSRQVVFEDFHKPTYAGWFVTGSAFGSGPTTRNEFLAELGRNPPVRTVIPPHVAHSGLLADKLQGTLRSQSFTITKKKIWYRIAGRDARVRLIIDGLQLIQEPIYGGLALNIDTGDRFEWRGQDVSMWPGQRAYIEILDDGPGFVAVERIVFSDDGPPPETERPSLAVPGRLNESNRLELVGLWNRARALEAELPIPRRGLAMADGTGWDEPVHIRGNHRMLGETAPRRFLEALGGKPEPAPSGSGRLELARHVTSQANPLLPRVIVNRLWQHHFGAGIVRSPDNFGALGERPTHPELLDFLACELVRNRWSLKTLHRMMVLSSTYQMASEPSILARTRDPQNRLLQHMPIQRLEVECVRDAMLAVAGSLNEQMGGPSVLPFLTPHMVGRGRPTTSGPLDGFGRRSIYLSVRRNFLNPFFLAFDYPIPFTTIGRRSSSNVPAQALGLLNNPFVIEQAGHLANRIGAQSGLNAGERIDRLYELAFGRLPSKAEKDQSLQFLLEQGAATTTGNDARASPAWRELCHVLFNVKDFIFVN